MMKIILGVPDAFSEQGQKSNQEDRYMPPRSEMNASRCFILCDGMGGHENGEVAAEIVSTSLYKFMTAGAGDTMTDERFSKALAETNAELDKMPVTEGKRPGTTMTCLYFGDNGVFAAHIGDSRIYQVRPGQGVVFKTRDHSLVNDLVRAGELTEEEARTFPRKNVITRAMQPGLDRPFRADTGLLTDVKAGDYFFMCCDGILEQLTDEQLVKILEDSTLTDKEKLDAIYDVCFGRTRDNFTCILIPVKDVEGVASSEAITAVVDVERPQTKVAPAAPKKDKNNKKWLYWAVGLIVLAAVAVLLIVLAKSDDKPEEPTPETVPPVPEETAKEEVKENEEILLYGNDTDVTEESDDDNDESDDDEDESDSKKSEVKNSESKDENPIKTTEELSKIIKEGVQQQQTPTPPHQTLQDKKEEKKNKEDNKNKG